MNKYPRLVVMPLGCIAMASNEEEYRRLKLHAAIGNAVFWLGIALAALVLLIGILTTEAEAGRYSDKYAGQRAQHFVIGGVIGGIAEYYYPEHWWLPILAPVIIGGVHEIFDENPDILDVVEWGVGGGLGKGTVMLFQYTWEF